MKPEPEPEPEPNHGQAGPVTNLVAGIMAGTLEAILVVAPVETVKTRLVDADQVRAVGVSRKGGRSSRLVGVAAAAAALVGVTGGGSTGGGGRGGRK
jgi:hypothetical protein